MPAFKVGASTLVLPCGKQLAPNSDATLTDAEVKNAGVQHWIGEGLLVEVAAEKPAPKAKKKTLTLG